MLVRDLMSAPVEVLPVGMTCAEAGDLFEQRGLRRAPVVRDGRVIGMLTDRDLAHILPSNIESIDAGRDHPAFKRRIENLIELKVHSVGPNDHVETAAELMLSAKVDALPVIDKGRAVGILTQSDLFKLFVRRGLTQSGHRLILRAPSAVLAELDPAAIAVKCRARLFDLAVLPLEGGRVAVSMKVHARDIEKLINAFLATHYELVLVEET